MAWGALAASSGCVRRALIGLPSESRTGPLLSDAVAGARGAAGGGACLAAPGDRTPARDICRPQGSCDGLRSGAARALSMFSGCQAARARASLRAPWVLKGAGTPTWVRGLPAGTRKPSQTRWCFFRGKGRLGRRRERGGAKPLGWARRGRVDATRTN